jgi:hypothetical protein
MTVPLTCGSLVQSWPQAPQLRASLGKHPPPQKSSVAGQPASGASPPSFPSGVGVCSLASASSDPLAASLASRVRASALAGPSPPVVESAATCPESASTPPSAPPPVAPVISVTPRIAVQPAANKSAATAAACCASHPRACAPIPPRSVIPAIVVAPVWPASFSERGSRALHGSAGTLEWPVCAWALASFASWGPARVVPRPQIGRTTRG